MINMIARLLAILNSETSPAQISLAFCFAMVAGLTPLVSLHNLPVFLLILLLRVNISAFLLGTLFFSALSYMLDPLFHYLGLAILSAGPLQELWTTAYNNPYIRLASFNNTIVMGSLVVSLLMFIPLYFISSYLIVKYRESVLEMVRKSRLMKLLKASKVFSVYERIASIRRGA